MYYNTSNLHLMYCALMCAIIIQLIDEGMGDYHFYSDETSDIRRGEAEIFEIFGEVVGRDEYSSRNNIVVIPPYTISVLSPRKQTFVKNICKEQTDDAVAASSLLRKQNKKSSTKFSYALS